MYRKSGLPESVLRRRICAVALLVAAAFPVVLVGTSAAQTASDPPGGSVSVRQGPAAPKSTTVWLNPSAIPSPATITRTPPDPSPLLEKDQWVYDLRYGSGDLYLLGIHRVELAEPQATPRAMGRFAFELYEGPTLIERVRFDFPMLGDVALAPAGSVPRAAASSPDPDAGRARPLHGPAPSLVSKLVTRVGVMFPASKRGTKLVIVDRATEARWPLPWPPLEMASPASSGDAFPPDAASADAR